MYVSVEYHSIEGDGVRGILIMAGVGRCVENVINISHSINITNIGHYGIIRGHFAEKVFGICQGVLAVYGILGIEVRVKLRAESRNRKTVKIILGICLVKLLIKLIEGIRRNYDSLKRFVNLKNCVEGLL